MTVGQQVFSYCIMRTARCKNQQQRKRQDVQAIDSIGSSARTKPNTSFVHLQQYDNATQREQAQQTSQSAQHIAAAHASGAITTLPHVHRRRRLTKRSAPNQTLHDSFARQKQQQQQTSKSSHLHRPQRHSSNASFAAALRVMCALVALAALISWGAARVEAQYRPEWPSKLLQQEIFLLNLEDGYFGCQVNESQDFLQLFELSRLCDGQPQCYLGTDEMASPLKCNQRDRCGVSVNARGQADPVQCVNGVCLDGLCYCNDGFGGKSCDVPDENECKYRPCDVFAHCTNTMGSYYCSCFPGYDGDGMHCQDINECEIPNLAALCSDNSECCNLPGHFVCKCKPGYQQAGSQSSAASSGQSTLTGAPSGNSTVVCTDIDECLDERACGRGATCENLPGSFRCACPPGFTGDPSVECIDMDECRNNPCGAGAQCTNIPGGYRCACAPGFERNPQLPAHMLGTVQSAAPNTLIDDMQRLSGGSNATAYSNSSALVACVDVNECLSAGSLDKPTCGVGAQCVNTPGGYFCQCPPNFTGNPKLGCVDVDECAAHACGPNAVCKNTPGSYKCECKPGYTGNAYLADGCQDEDECATRPDACGANAQCFNTLGSFQCSCLSGFAGDPFAGCADIDECSTPNAGSQATPGRQAVGNGAACGPGAQCINTPGSYKCACPDKFMARGSPEMGCERAAVDIGCSGDYDCTRNALCLNSTCQCKLGYQINGIECVDVDECALTSSVAAPAKPFTKINAAQQQQQQQYNATTATTTLCGAEAACINTDGAYKCECKQGYEKLVAGSPTAKCRDVNECDAAQPVCGPNSRCFNTDGAFKCACNDGFIPIDSDLTLGCKSPCDGVNCGQHATCKPHGEEAACVCKPGFTFDPNNIQLGCVDINECDTNYGPAGLCGQRAQCTNVPGSYRCHCPSGYAGDAYRYCEDVNECDRRFGVFGQCGELAVCNNTQGSYSCACAPGYTGDPRVRCTDIDECRSSGGASPCGQNAECLNTPGKFQCKCPDGYAGDPHERCVAEAPACATTIDCPTNQVCAKNGRCQCPYPALDAADGNNKCRHPCERTECGAHATCQLDSDNQPICVCDAGYMAPSDGRSGCMDVNECIQGVTLSGVTPLSALTSGRGGVALGPSERATGSTPGTNSTHPCGRNALCRNQPGSFDCVCPPGYSGNAYEACSLDISRQPPQMPQPPATVYSLMNTEPTSTSTPTPTMQQQQQQEQHFISGNYQQEPRTGACQGECPRGSTCFDGQCVRPDACRDDRDCRSAMTCVHASASLGRQCVNVCEISAHVCGPEAKCSGVNHKPVCSCNTSAGYLGDPYDLVHGCQASSASSPSISSSSASASSSSSTTASMQDDVDSHRTTASNLADTSTTHGFDSANQQQQTTYGLSGTSAPVTPPTFTTTTTTTAAATSAASVDRFESHREPQRPPQQTTKAPNQPLVSYELPLPTTPIMPQFSAAYEQQQQHYARQNLTAPNLDASAILSAQQQQQQNLAQNLFANKRRQQQQQQQQQQRLQQQQASSTVISNNADIAQQQQLGASSGQHRQGDDSGYSSGADSALSGNTGSNSYLASGFSNKSLTSALFQQQQQQQHQQQQQQQQQQQFAYKQITCTNDQHCPGNLFCLQSEQLTSTSTAAALLSKQPALGDKKLCGCPAGYRREADYCYMQRVNCTSAAMCRPREECVLTYFSPAPANTINQQFQLSSSSSFASSESTAMGICVCPRGYKLQAGACVDRNECDEGTPCALGAVCQNRVGSYECVCPPGTVGEPYTKTCEPLSSVAQQQSAADELQQQFATTQQQQQQRQPSTPPTSQFVECSSSAECANDRECDRASARCVSPCHACGPRAVCTATNHRAICVCPPRHAGNPLDLVYGCQEAAQVSASLQQQQQQQAANLTSLSKQQPVLASGSVTGLAAAAAAPPTQPPATALGVPVTTLLPSTTVAPLETTTPELVEFRTIPPSELFVMCLADGIQVEVQLGGFDGIIYVKGHSQDPKCRKLVTSSSANEFVDFKVQFGHCDLIHRDGEAGFVLVIQKHPKLVTYRARAYHVKCVYNTGERTVTLGFNVSMITTSGTIANTGPPPTCLMSITALDGHEVTSAEIGQDLLLRVDVQPESIYGGFARSCEAKTMDDEGEYQYEVTDANGCATDASIFSDWKYDQHRKSLVARFNAFKFPSSNNLRFQCNIRVCFGSCPAVNCNGVDAYGRRRRRRRDVSGVGGATIGGRLNMSAALGADERLLDGAPDELIVSDAFKEGALREEIMVQSNAILAFDRKEASLPQQQRSAKSADSTATPQSSGNTPEEIEFVCLPRLSIVMSVGLTTLMALLALAIGTSCWCFATRRKQQRQQHTHHAAHRKMGARPAGPLPHPVNFPNPLMRSPASSTASTLREPIYGP